MSNRDIAFECVRPTLPHGPQWGPQRATFGQAGRFEYMDENGSLFDCSRCYLLFGGIPTQSIE